MLSRHCFDLFMFAVVTEMTNRIYIYTLIIILLIHKVYTYILVRIAKIYLIKILFPVLYTSSSMYAWYITTTTILPNDARMCKQMLASCHVSLLRRTLNSIDEVINLSWQLVSNLYYPHTNILVTGQACACPYLLKELWQCKVSSHFDWHAVDVIGMVSFKIGI